MFNSKCITRLAPGLFRGLSAQWNSFTSEGTLFVFRAPAGMIMIHGIDDIPRNRLRIDLRITNSNDIKTIISEFALSCKSWHKKQSSMNMIQCEIQFCEYLILSSNFHFK